MARHLVLFAREPGREAREKGLARRAAAELFAEFARGWLRAAELAGARISVAAPPEDVAAWRRRIPDTDVRWISQRGSSFGDRLRAAGREASPLGGPLVFVGGDVPADAVALRRAFEALERGAPAVLCPAPDGGVSLMGLATIDQDLLARVPWGGSTVFEELVARHAARGKLAEVLQPLPDVDGRRDLRRLLREGVVVASLIRAALRVVLRPIGIARPAPRSVRLPAPSRFRAPPAAA